MNHQHHSQHCNDYSPPSCSPDNYCYNYIPYPIPGPTGPAGSNGSTGATGPTGPTGTIPAIPTNQFYSIGISFTKQSIPLGVTTPVLFNALFAHNGTDITTDVTPTTSGTSLTLAANHSYYIFYSLKVTFQSNAGIISAALYENNTPLLATDVSSSGNNEQSVSSGTIITTSSTPIVITLQASSQLTPGTVINASMSAIQLM